MGGSFDESESIGANRTRCAPVTSQRLMDGRHHLVVYWKPVSALLRHGLLIDPYRELTTPALDELGVDPSLLLDERRHTGRAGTVISNLAVSNTDALHDASRFNWRRAPRFTNT